ncbi:MAG: hypothetical protein JXX14_00810 [Deltaproteobacteria bacterium]|nr:hypothetical protein [Deltaproteobacteria bacterium]
MSNYIVITSISRPTQAVREFAALCGYHLVVAGDQKTPADWECENVTFISAAQQQALAYPLTKTLPWNHYCRKMIGYIYAIRAGATVIVDTDDDNLPYENWTFPTFSGDFDVLQSNASFFNIYSLYTKRKVWPRGYPLELICSEVSVQIDKSSTTVGVWQGLADDDPDVDAIYRLVFSELFKFEKRAPVVLSPGVYCPYNSQNTATRKELFALLYLPATVTFRFTDILRGIVAQPIMNAAGFSLGFTEATVYQERNEHNLLADFVSEIPCYTQIQDVINFVSSAISRRASVGDNLYNAYISLEKNKIVTTDELSILESWLQSI